MMPNSAAGVLSGGVVRTIRAVIRAERGAEVCGYLLEGAGGEQRFLTIENRLASRDGCFVAAADVARARKFAAARALRIRAWVHSHPAGTTLSAVDRMGLAESDIPWIVVCDTGGDLRAEWHAPGATQEVPEASTP